MKRTRRFFRWGLAVFAIWLALNLVIGMVAGGWALHPWRRALEPRAVELAQATAERNQAKLADVSVVAGDGVFLRGWSIQPLHGNGDAVILLHGVGDNRAGVLGDAELLLRHGYAVLLPDARAHGASGGALATYGLKESDDLRRWFDWLEHTESPRCIDGLGESMGAALLLESLSTTPGYCAVAAESPFANFREASYDRLAEPFHAGAWMGRIVLRPAVETGLLLARWKYGVALEQDSPEEAVAASRVPVLLIHGQKDRKLPAYNSEEIQARNSAVVLWEPAEAGHCGAAGAEPAEFERRVIGWFASHDAARSIPEPVHTLFPK